MFLKVSTCSWIINIHLKFEHDRCLHALFKYHLDSKFDLEYTDMILTRKKKKCIFRLFECMVVEPLCKSHELNLWPPWSLIVFYIFCSFKICIYFLIRIETLRVFWFGFVLCKTQSKFRSFMEKYLL